MATPIDLDQLRTFVAIVDTGSFTRAAEDVFKTQSAVSMQMRRLEERLGVKLFERSGRAIEITDDGTRLLNYARRMLVLSQETLSAFDENAMQGLVRIGLPDDYAERFLPEILARFSRSNPLVELSIACEPSINLADAINKGRLDVALVARAMACWPKSFGTSLCISSPRRATTSIRKRWCRSPSAGKIAPGEPMGSRRWKRRGVATRFCSRPGPRRSSPRRFWRGSRSVFCPNARFGRACASLARPRAIRASPTTRSASFAPRMPMARW